MRQFGHLAQLTTGRDRQCNVFVEPTKTPTRPHERRRLVRPQSADQQECNAPRRRTNSRGTIRRPDTGSVRAVSDGSFQIATATPWRETLNILWADFAGGVRLPRATSSAEVAVPRLTRAILRYWWELRKEGFGLFFPSVRHAGPEHDFDAFPNDPPEDQADQDPSQGGERGGQRISQSADVKDPTQGSDRRIK